MADPTDLTPAIETAAQSPQSVRTTAASVQQQPIPHMIAADQYAALAAGVRKKRRGMRISKLIGPAQVSGIRIYPGDDYVGNFGAF